MASSEEKSSSRSGLGWFPKLILWVAVMAFGYVYLSSVDREDGGTTASSMLDSIAKLSPVSLSSLPGFSDKKEESAGESAEAIQAHETPKTESAASAHALVSDKPDAAASGPAQVAETPKTVPQPPVSYAAAALKMPADASSAPAVSASPEQPAPVAPDVSAAVEPAASVATAPAGTQPESMLPPAMPVPGESAPVARRPASEWAAMREQQRAEMMARYEAMRREADERMRQYWGQMPEARLMPPAVPYGYPGYAPGYMPGYAPGVYGPPVR